MPWLQLKISTSETHGEYFSDQLMASGAAAVTMQDAADQEIFEPVLGTTPLWSATKVTGLFETNTDLIEIVNTLKLTATTEKNICAQYSIEQLEDKDWVRAWMDDFVPMQFAEKLWLCPSWSEPPDASATNIMLDPGLAFGTGTHATTAMCMHWLGVNAIPDFVIDYGCGSGILAVTAAKLGASHVNAVDTDPQALSATQQNAQKNNSVQKITTYFPNQLPDTKTELLIANILAQPLIDLAPKFKDLLCSNAYLVLSGILQNQAKMVIQAYSSFLDLKIENQRQEWVCLTGRMP